MPDQHPGDDRQRRLHSTQDQRPEDLGDDLSPLRSLAETTTPKPALAKAMDHLRANPPKRRTLGDYELMHEVGRGGMGVVFAANDKKLERTVAIKVATRAVSVNEETDRRFLREARAIASVKHENIVAVYSVEQTADRLFLVMELVAGESLAARLKRVRRVSWQEAARIGAQIASALVAAHAEGICHRDIKPANLLLEARDDRVKVTDFGLAKNSDDATLTAAGLVVGTPEYMSPEQAAGQPTGAATDLFSLGVVLYEACSGISPFQAETTVAVLGRIANHHPPPLHQVNPDIPEWFSLLVSELLAKEASKRISSAGKVCERLLHSNDDYADASWRPHRLAATGALATFAVVLACFFVWKSWVDGSTAPSQTATAPESNAPTSGFMVGEKHFSTLEAAILESPQIDGLIEVLGTGPYLVDLPDLESKSLTIRGSSSRPVFRPKGRTASGPFIRADNGVRLENISVVWNRADQSFGSVESYLDKAVIESKGGDVRVTNCHFAASGNACIACDAGSISSSRCTFDSDDSPGIVWKPAGNKVLSGTDCIWTGRQSAVGMIAHGEEDSNARVSLEHNLFQTRAVINVTIEESMQPLRFETKWNAIDSEILLLISKGNSFPATMMTFEDIGRWRDRCEWTDACNGLRPGMTYLARGDFSLRTQLQSFTPSLERWNRRWGMVANNSLELDFEIINHGDEKPSILFPGNEVNASFEIQEIGPRS